MSETANVGQSACLKPANAIMVVFIAVFMVLGILLRLPAPEGTYRTGNDEHYYEEYVRGLARVGLAGWSALLEAYIDKQTIAPHAFLPPTRVTFLCSAYLWHSITGQTPLQSTRAVSCCAAVAMLMLAAYIAARWGGLQMSALVTTLGALSPLPIHIAHRALIDGFFALAATFAIWSLFECLMQPAKRRWLFAYGAALAMLVLTKENAAFVYLALCGVIVANRWLSIGRVTKALLIVTIVGPTLGSAVLVTLAGGPETLIEAFRLNVAKSVTLPYAIATGDGLWHRYFTDFVLVNPVLVVLAAASAFAGRWDARQRYLVAFVGLSYAIMAQIRFGMNMRYGMIWEFPFLWLAATSLSELRFGPPVWRPALSLGCAMVVAICSAACYSQMFSNGIVYDPVAGSIIQKLGIWSKNR